MHVLVRWVTNLEIAFYMFLVLAAWTFVEAGIWLDTKWSEKTIEHPDERALSEAAAILGETVEVVRRHVTRADA